MADEATPAPGLSGIAIRPAMSHIAVLLLGFFVARGMLSHDVQQKLMAGDTVELWGGAWSFNLKQVTDFLVNSWPIVLPIGLAMWARIKARFALIKARMSPKEMSAGEVQTIVAATPAAEILQTVISKP